MAQIRIGISGWTYPPWRGVFYPKGLAHRRELEYASSLLRTIEINGSFYALQRPESYREWHDRTPDDFVFAVKGGRFITHMKKLRGVETPLANFFASGVLALGLKLGPVLWQLPPNLGFDRDRTADFLAMLPRTTGEAARLAAQHDATVEGRALVSCEVDRPIRHALEVRHSSFDTDAFTDLLREQDVAVVTADTAGKWPQIMEPTTSDLAYVRLHGAEELYTSGYDDEALERWAAVVAEWRDGGRDVYVYFDNDAKVRAPFDAQSLAHLLGVGPPSRSDGPVAADRR
jgi:uncharacterized protein YecE (DUF72 family)